MPELKQESAGRLDYVTAAKALGICLVVVGHCVPSLPIRQWIYLFHMPLFFFLSGYCFKESAAENVRSYIGKKIKGLYLPFVTCNLIALVFHPFFCRIGLYDPADRFTSAVGFLKYLVKILLCVKMEDVVAPMWFLPILMFVSVGFCLLTKIKISLRLPEPVIHVAVLVLYAVAYLLPSRGGLLRAYILVALGLFVFDLGVLCRKYRLYERLSRFNREVCRYALPAACFGVLASAASYVDFNMIQMRLGNPLLVPLLHLLGIYMTLETADALSKAITKLVLYVGERTLTVLKWHYYVFFVVTVLQNKIVTGHSLTGIHAFVLYLTQSVVFKTLLFAVYAFAGVAVPLTAKELCGRAGRRFAARRGIDREE